MGIMFSPDMLELVLSGKKTQTRRKWLASDTLLHNRDWLRLDNCPNPFINAEWVKRRDKYQRYKSHWRVGDTYAIQPGRGKKSVGRVRLTAIRLERFCDISQADAVAEGFANPDGFFAKIRELYGADFDLTAPCWALSFELVTP